ncbi:MAG: murein hydrolase activator EnvC family protein [Haemophilus parainfluenzae]
MKSFTYVILIGTAIGYASPVLAANSETEQLQTIRQAIDAAKKDLAAKKAAQKKAQEALDRAQAALVQVKRELEEINKKQNEAWQRLQTLQDSLTKLHAEISQTKSQVARLIASNYKNKPSPVLALFLRDADVNQKSRFLNYTRYINAANDEIIKKLVSQQKELAQQETEINKQLTILKNLSIQQQEKMRRLGQESSRAQLENKRLTGDIANRQQKLSQLREDEQRLNKLVAELTVKKNEQRKAQNQELNNQQNNDHSPKNNSMQPENNKNNEGFGRNSLPMPVNGNVVGQYGAPRETGGIWQGLFIETAPTPVKSIAEGEVLHVTNMKGYGNTVLIDHGSGYVSVYMGLSAVSVSAGNRVAARQTIGTSGQLPAGEEGLYFQIRYRNQVMNPRSWVR